ncbi:MAG: ArsA family ATPase [Acidimicrobiia bacterium]|nr:ArsA family ATPase [Acidimicrobiia bacterium]
MISWQRPVQICLGPGGVGKTTISAASGIAGALAGERVVVLTIDPARRLADVLGLVRPSARALGGGDALGNEPRLVPGPWPGELWAAMLDPAETLTGLIRRYGGEQQAERVLANPLFAPISASLSGIGEYMAAERLRELHLDPRFDRVVIDTPPSRHAVDFLDSPQRLTNFVDNRFYRLVLAPRRALVRSVSVAAKLVVRTTARLVGAELVDDVIALFADLSGLDQGFRQRAVETSALLDGPDCAYLLVTTARHEPLREARWIRNNLTRRHKSIDTVIVNRLSPAAGLENLIITGGRKADRAALQANVDQLLSLRRQEDELVADVTRSSSALGIEDRGAPIRSIEDLAEVAAQLRPLPAAAGDRSRR